MHFFDFSSDFGWVSIDVSLVLPNLVGYFNMSAVRRELLERHLLLWPILKQSLNNRLTDVVSVLFNQLANGLLWAFSRDVLKKLVHFIAFFKVLKKTCYLSLAKIGLYLGYLDC